MCYRFVGEGADVMEMEKIQGAVPENDDYHALDCVPNIQSIGIITMGPYKNSTLPVKNEKAGKAALGERLCIKKWNQGHNPTGTTKVGFLATTSC